MPSTSTYYPEPPPLPPKVPHKILKNLVYIFFKIGVYHQASRKLLPCIPAADQHLKLKRKSLGYLYVPQDSSSSGGTISIHTLIICCIGWEKDDLSDGSYTPVFECKKFHSKPSLFIYITPLYKLQMNRVVYSSKVQLLCKKRFTARLVYIIHYIS